MSKMLCIMWSIKFLKSPFVVFIILCGFIFGIFSIFDFFGFFGFILLFLVIKTPFQSLLFLASQVSLAHDDFVPLLHLLFFLYFIYFVSLYSIYFPPRSKILPLIFRLLLHSSHSFSTCFRLSSTFPHILHSLSVSSFH